MTEEQRVNLYDSLERISHNLEQYLAEFPSEHPPKNEQGETFSCQTIIKRIGILSWKKYVLSQTPHLI